MVQPNPGAQNAAPLNGTELVDIIGLTWGTDTTGNLANTRTVDNAKTATGTTRADAYSITKVITRFTTVAASTGAVLPSATKPGAKYTIFNDGASALTVYGAGSDTIDGTAGATGVALTNAKRCDYICVATGVWISAQLGVVSA